MVAGFSLLIFFILLSGCAHGPVRHHTLGYYRYASVELTKRSAPLVKPLSLAAGLAADIVLVAVDTGTTPIAALFVPGSGVAVTQNEEISTFANLIIPTYPFILADIGAMEMGAGTKEEYEEIFGDESSLFRETGHRDQEENKSR